MNKKWADAGAIVACTAMGMIGGFAIGVTAEAKAQDGTRDGAGWEQVAPRLHRIELQDRGLECYITRPLNSDHLWCRSIETEATR